MTHKKTAISHGKHSILIFGGKELSAKCQFIFGINEKEIQSIITSDSHGLACNTFDTT